MKVCLVQTENFSKDVLQNLLILLNKNRGIASFSAIPSSIQLLHEDLSTRCLPCQKLENKFLLEKSLLKETIRVLPEIGGREQYLQSGTFSDNSMYVRYLSAYNASHLPELKKYSLEHLINGILRVSFLKHSFPFASLDPTQLHECEPKQQHDVYTISQLLFEKCKQLRKDHSLLEEDYLVLLTNGNLDSNWIYTLDPSYGNNLIINSCPLFSFGNHQLPAILAYHLVIGLLAKKSFRSFLDWYLHQHPHPVNCVMDFNMEHANVLQNSKSAQICEQCQALINEATVTPVLFEQLNGILINLRRELRGRAIPLR